MFGSAYEAQVSQETLSLQTFEHFYRKKSWVSFVKQVSVTPSEPYMLNHTCRVLILMSGEEVGNRRNTLVQKRKKKIIENQTHGWLCFWSPLQRQWDNLASNQLFLTAWSEKCRLFRCKQTQRIPEGSSSSSEGDYRRSSDHTTMAGFELLKDAQTGVRANAAAASRNKIFKKIAFIQDSVVYTLIYGKGTQK